MTDFKRKSSYSGAVVTGTLWSAFIFITLFISFPKVKSHTLQIYLEKVPSRLKTAGRSVAEKKAAPVRNFSFSFADADIEHAQEPSLQNPVSDKPVLALAEKKDETLPDVSFEFSFTPDFADISLEPVTEEPAIPTEDAIPTSQPAVATLLGDDTDVDIQKNASAALAEKQKAEKERQEKRKVLIASAPIPRMSFVSSLKPEPKPVVAQVPAEDAISAKNAISAKDAISTKDAEGKNVSVAKAGEQKNAVQPAAEQKPVAVAKTADEKKPAVAKPAEKNLSIEELAAKAHEAERSQIAEKEAQKQQKRKENIASAAVPKMDFVAAMKKNSDKNDNVAVQDSAKQSSAPETPSKTDEKREPQPVKASTASDNAFDKLSQKNNASAVAKAGMSETPAKKDSKTAEKKKQETVKATTAVAVAAQKQESQKAAKEENKPAEQKAALPVTVTTAQKSIAENAVAAAKKGNTPATSAKTKVEQPASVAKTDVDVKASKKEDKDSAVTVAAAVPKKQQPVADKKEVKAVEQKKPVQANVAKTTPAAPKKEQKKTAAAPKTKQSATVAKNSEKTKASASQTKKAETAKKTEVAAKSGANKKNAPATESKNAKTETAVKNLEQAKKQILAPVTVPSLQKEGDFVVQADKEIKMPEPAEKSAVAALIEKSKAEKAASVKTSTAKNTKNVDISKTGSRGGIVTVRTNGRIAADKSTSVIPAEQGKKNVPTVQTPATATQKSAAQTQNVRQQQSEQKPTQSEAKKAEKPIKTDASNKNASQAAVEKPAVAPVAPASATEASSTAASSTAKSGFATSFFTKDCGRGVTTSVAISTAKNADGKYAVNASDNNPRTLVSGSSFEIALSNTSTAVINGNRKLSVSFTITSAGTVPLNKIRFSGGGLPGSVSADIQRQIAAWKFDKADGNTTVSFDLTLEKK